MRIASKSQNQKLASRNQPCVLGKCSPLLDMCNDGAQKKDSHVLHEIKLTVGNRKLDQY